MNYFPLLKASPFTIKAQRDIIARIIEWGKRWSETMRPVSSVKTSSYTALPTDFLILADSSGGAVTITLPAVLAGAERIYCIKAVNVGANPVTVATADSATIDGASTYELTTQYDQIVVQCDDTNWHTLSVSKDTSTTTTVSTTYTITLADEVVFVDTDSAGVAITLPAGVDGKHFRISNTGTSGNNVTLTPDGSELLIGVNSSFTLRDGECLDIIFDSTEGWA